MDGRGARLHFARESRRGKGGSRDRRWWPSLVPFLSIQNLAVVVHDDLIQQERLRGWWGEKGGATLPLGGRTVLGGSVRTRSKRKIRGAFGFGAWGQRVGFDL